MGGTFLLLRSPYHRHHRNWAFESGFHVKKEQSLSYLALIVHYIWLSLSDRLWSDDEEEAKSGNILTTFEASGLPGLIQYFLLTGIHGEENEGGFSIRCIMCTG